MNDDGIPETLCDNYDDDNNSEHFIGPLAAAADLGSLRCKQLLRQAMA